MSLSKFLFLYLIGLLVASSTLAEERPKYEIVALDIFESTGDYYMDMCINPNIYRVDFLSGPRFYENAEPRKLYKGHKIVLEERASINNSKGRIIFYGYFLYNEKGEIIQWFDTTDFALKKVEGGYKLISHDRRIINSEAFAPNFEGPTIHTL